MDEIKFSDLLAIIPLFLYILFIALLYWRRRPTLLDGRTDALLLALGLSGVVMTKIAPAIIPFQALRNYGFAAWILLFFLYLFVVFFLSSTLSRKFIIYNLSVQRFREILQNKYPQHQIPTENADIPRFSGKILEIPSKSITAWIGAFFPKTGCVVLTLLEPFPTPKNWRSFCGEIRDLVSKAEISSPSIWAWGLTLLDICLGIWIWVML